MTPVAETDSTATTPKIADWKERAHPSARLVGREVRRALDRQLKHLDSLDTKGSYLAAANVVVLGAFLTGLSLHPVHGERLQDLVAVALIFGIVGLAASIYTWWPRDANAPPNPRGLREKFFNAREADALQEITDEGVLAFEQNKRIENRKLTGIRVASAFLFLAVVVAAVGSYIVFVL
jgi:hypothetical protein